MYKKASKMKLRFPSKFGALVVEQLWELKMSDLKTLIKGAHEELKKVERVDDDLAFLEGAIGTTAERKAAEEAQLRFDILKDIWETRANEVKDAATSAAKKAQIDHLEEILQRKKEKELEDMSMEDLEKKIAELRGGN